jgi:opacity protein-like surface antigen
MKKVLLVTALAAVSISATEAATTAPKYSPNGNGFYIMGQIGEGR